MKGVHDIPLASQSPQRHYGPRRLTGSLVILGFVMLKQATKFVHVVTTHSQIDGVVVGAGHNLVDILESSIK